MDGRSTESRDPAQGDFSDWVSMPIRQLHVSLMHHWHGPSANPGAYTFTTFDGPGDHAGGTTVNGMSNSGRIVGFSSNADGTVRTGFVRDRDGELATLDLGDPQAVANGINTSDQIVGVSGDNAFILSGDEMTLSTLAPAATMNAASQIAFGVNDRGAIVGQYAIGPSSPMNPGFLDMNGAFTTVSPPMAVVTNAQGVNSSGKVIGFSATAAALAGPVIAGNVAEHGFLYDSGTSTYTMLPDPNQPNLFLSQYLGINDDDMSVGYWQDMAGSQHGFVYDLDAQSFTLLDAPGAALVNGVTITQIVGISMRNELAGFYVGADGIAHGFVTAVSKHRGGGNGEDGNGGGGAAPGGAGYTFTSFDGPGDHAGGTTVNGISSNGFVVGFSSNADGSVLTPFVRGPNGSFTVLDLGDPKAQGIGINGMGLVVGGSGQSAIALETRSMRLTVLPAVTYSNTATELAFGINDRGSIVGQYTTLTASTTSPGFLYAAGAFTTVSPPMAAATNAQGVDQHGRVVGFFSTAAQLAGPVIAGNPEQHGFLFDSASGSYTMLPDPMQPNLFLSQYLAINDTGRAAGYWQDMAGSQHGFIYDIASMTFTLIDHPDAAPVDGVSTTQIVGISSSNEIAGFFIDANGAQHGFYAAPRGGD
jgi:hypothetical protein